MSSLDERIEYLAERQVRGELTDLDIAELTELCRDPDARRDYVEALADRHEWRQVTGAAESGESFVKSVLQRSGRRMPSGVFVQAVTDAARQPQRELQPKGRSIRRKFRQTDDSAGIFTAIAACAALAILLFAYMSSGNSSKRIVQPKESVPIAPVKDPAPELAQIEQNRQRVRQELANVEAERRRMQERLLEIEKQKRLITAEVVSATPGKDDERRQVLDRIEAERRKVDEDLAAMLSTRRTTEAELRVIEAQREKAEAAQQSARVAENKTPAPVAPAANAAVIARVDKVTGDAFVVTRQEGRRAMAGMEIARGEGVETGPIGSLSLSFLDRTKLEIASDTLIGELIGSSAIDAGYGKSVKLDRGALTADVTAQPKELPMILKTVHAEVKVLGTRFKLSATNNESRVEMYSGTVSFRNLRTGKTVEISGGKTARVEKGLEIVVSSNARFFKGVNFYGEEVRIEDNRWLSYKDALVDGLSVSPNPSVTKTDITPVPFGDGATTDMLNTAIFVPNASMTVKQTLPNGDYVVYLWVMENLANKHRAFDIRVENSLVVKNFGPEMLVGDWRKLGPFPCVIKDGVLDIDFIKVETDPHVMGMAIYQIGENKSGAARMKPDPAE